MLDKLATESAVRPLVDAIIRDNLRDTIKGICNHEYGYRGVITYVLESGRSLLGFYSLLANDKIEIYSTLVQINKHKRFTYSLNGQSGKNCRNIY